MTRIRIVQRSCAFASPTILAGVNSSSNEHSPSLTPDERSLAFSSNITGKESIYLAQCSTRLGDFGVPVLHPALSADTAVATDPALGIENLEILFTKRDGGEQAIERATRTSTTDLFSNAEEILPSEGDAFTGPQGPYLSLDAHTLYFSANRRTTGRSILWKTDRATREDPFGVPEVVGTSDVIDLAWPTVSTDELEAFVEGGAQLGDGAVDIWKATRDSKDDLFLNWELVPELSTDAGDGDPELSRDGNTIFLASGRDGASNRYVATRQCK